MSFFCAAPGRCRGWITAICRSSAGLAPAGAAAWAGRMRPWGRDSRRSRVPGGCVWVRRKRQGGEEAPLLLALLQARLVAGAGHQPMEGPNRGCPLLPCPGQPRLVQGSPPHVYLLLSLFFPSFSPILTPSPLRRLRPSRGSCLLALHGDSRALAPSGRQIRTLLCFPQTKRCPALPQLRAGDRNFPKTEQKPSPFLSRELPLLPGPSGGDCARPEVGERRNQTGQGPAWFLPIPINRKLGGGGEREK